MTLRQLAFFLALAVTAATSWSAGSSARTAKAPHYADMLRTINRQGSVRVIVSTAATSPARLTGSTIASLAQQRQGVLDQLRSKQLQPQSLSRFGRRAVFVVDQTQLEQLIATAGVASVIEDRLMKPSLVSATALINTAVPHAAGIAGAGTVVAILDTGIDGDHEAFGNRIVAQACFSTKYTTFGASHLCANLSPNGGNGQRTDIGPGAAEACSGVNGCDHGTHVASIAAGDSATITGVAPQASIIAVQVFSKFTDYEPVCGSPTGSCLSAFTSDVLDGLDYIASLAGSYAIAGVNLSLGDGVEYQTYCASDAYAPAINNLYSLGIVTAAAAGNESFQNGVSSPACIESAIAVGAVRDDDVVPNWSNSDDTLVDMLAPGVSITAAVTNNGYGTKSGTSMATPMVTGALAVLRSQNPALSTAQLVSLLADYSWTTSTRVLNNRAGNDPQPRLDFGKIFLPRVQINAPADGTTLTDNDSIVLAASASDAQDGDLTGSLSWSSSLDGALSNPTTLSAGVHVITASVFDSHGMAASDTVSVNVTAFDPDSDGDGIDDVWELTYFGDLSQDGGGDFDSDGFINSVEFSNGTHPNDKAPTVAILSPATNSAFASGAAVTLTGSASDQEDGDLSTVISWSSDRDGNLGTGATLNTALLTAGSHTISATVLDSAGGWPFAVPSVTVQILQRDGDLNDDGDVDAADLVLLQRHLSGAGTLSAPATIRADLYPTNGSGDGVIDQSDLLLLQKLILGL